MISQENLMKTIYYRLCQSQECSSLVKMKSVDMNRCFVSAHNIFNGMVTAFMFKYLKIPLYYIYNIELICNGMQIYTRDVIYIN